MALEEEKTVLPKTLDTQDPIFINNRTKLLNLLKSDDSATFNSGWLLLDTLVSEYSDFQKYLDLPDVFSSYLELYKRFSDYPLQKEITLHVIKKLKQYNAPWLNTRKRTYAVNMYGWEWEYVQHELTKKQYEFWKQTDISLDEYIHDTLEDQLIETIPEYAQFRLAKNHPLEWTRNDHAPDYCMEWHELSSLGHESGVDFDNYISIKEVIKLNWRTQIELETVFEGTFDDLKKQGGTVIYPEKTQSQRSESPKTRYGVKISLASKGEVAKGTFECSNSLNLTKFRAEAFLEGSTYYYCHEESLSYQDGEQDISITTELDHSWVKSSSAELFML